MWQKRKILILVVLTVLFSATLAFASLPLFQTLPQPLSSTGNKDINVSLGKVLPENESANYSVWREKLNYKAWRKIQTSA